MADYNKPDLYQRQTQGDADDKFHTPQLVGTHTVETFPGTESV